MHIFCNILILEIIVGFLEYFVLAYFYQKNFKKAVVIALYVLMSFVGINIVSALVIGHYWTTIFDAERGGTTITEYILGCLLWSLELVILSKVINKDVDYECGCKDWISICCVPVGVIAISLTMITSGYMIWQCVCISVAILVAISIIILDMFQNMMLKGSSNNKEAFQDVYLKNQFELMKTSFENMRSVNHDIQNHLYALSLYIQKNNIDGALDYIAKLGTVCYEENEYISTGNLGIDGILNYKINNAIEKGIHVETDIKIPEDLSFASVDAITILGNLFDNAIRAVEEVKFEQDRIIKLTMHYRKGVLFISMKNKYVGEILWKDKMILSNKSDIENHGIGIKSIKRVLEKYNGALDILCENSMFSADVIVYI